MKDEVKDFTVSWQGSHLQYAGWNGCLEECEYMVSVRGLSAPLSPHWGGFQSRCLLRHTCLGQFRDAGAPQAPPTEQDAAMALCGQCAHGSHPSPNGPWEMGSEPGPAQPDGK